jgi:hypothetical protein
MECDEEKKRGGQVMDSSTKGVADIDSDKAGIEKAIVLLALITAFEKGRSETLQECH